MICRVKCSCPNKHLIEVILGAAEEGADATEITKWLAISLKFKMELWMLEGRLGDKCEICQAPFRQFVFIGDSLHVESTEDLIREIYAEAQPELLKQRALRHARKGVN